MAWFVTLVVISVFIIVDKCNSNCPNQQSIEESLRKAYIPGAVIVVVNASDIIYEQAFGYQSLAPKQPMNVRDSIFTLASVSKPFIGVAVMQLVEKGLVNLDVDINQYLSECNAKIYHPQYPSHPITLRQLLSHTASIDVKTSPFSDFIKPDDSWVSPDVTLANIIFTYLNPNASNWLPKPPGSVALYSNEGSALAALVVERMTKIPYDQYVKEYIFKPLNIDTRKIGVRLTDFENREELVKHYLYVTNESFLSLLHEELPQFNITLIEDELSTWLHVQFYSVRVYPAGLLRMPAHPISAFLRMILNNGSSILTTESIDEMLKVIGDGLIPFYSEDSNSNSTDPPILSESGLGWFWMTLRDGHRYFGHNGGLPGVANLILINEKRTIGVIVLTNGDMLQPIDLSREVFETILNIHTQLFECFDTKSVN